MTDDYAAGVCNIGPQEIQARRRFGHMGAAVSLAFGALMLASGAPHLLRLLVLFPAAGAAMGYLQAAFRFCAGFGMRGVYNFGRLGSVRDVATEEARLRDRRRALQITGLSLLIGVAAALVLYRA
jgi:hypothetical protein